MRRLDELHLDYPSRDAYAAIVAAAGGRIRRSPPHRDADEAHGIEASIVAEQRASRIPWSHKTVYAYLNHARCDQTRVGADHALAHPNDIT